MEIKKLNMKHIINIKSEKPLVVVPLEKYEGMLETIEILSGNNNILDELKNEKREFIKGNYVIHEKLNRTRKKGLSK
ncbi:MAG: hypothetical protein K8I03_02200 [Ignavibacteria bacterium]|nr:hypothetical protein [Ignavibacteria bacterium]